MKIRIKDVTDEVNFLSHLVLESITESAMKTITNIKDRDKDTEFDLTLHFNGIEIDITKFLKLLNDGFYGEVKKQCKPEALKIFEEYKHKFKSKNSTNAKLSKIKEQLDKANNQLINIKESIKQIL